MDKSIWRNASANKHDVTCHRLLHTQQAAYDHTRRQDRERRQRIGKSEPQTTIVLTEDELQCRIKKRDQRDGAKHFAHLAKFPPTAPVKPTKSKNTNRQAHQQGQFAPSA